MSYPPSNNDPSYGDQPPGQGYPPPNQPYGPPPNYPPPGQPYSPPPGQAYSPPPNYAPPNQPYGYPPTGYGMQPPPIGAYVSVPNQSNGLATASLVLGILGFFFGFLTGIPAVITGHMALNRISRNPVLSGRGQAIVGLVLGYIIIGITVIAVIIVISTSAR